MGSRPFIVLGDSTSHGGTVAEASCMTDTHGKGIARIGDQVTCPIPGHGTTVIVSGDPTMIIDGKPAARHGDKCACGAVLISSQVVSTTGDGGASNPQAASAAQAAKASGYQPFTLRIDESTGLLVREEAPTQTPNNQDAHDHRFALKCNLTGMPLAGQPYRLKANGKTIEGVADKDGMTKPISTDFESADVECEILGEVIDG